MKAGYSGEAVLGIADGRLKGELVEGSGIEEPVPSLESLLDAFVEILEYDITKHRVSLELVNRVVGRLIKRQENNKEAEKPVQSAPEGRNDCL